MAGYFSNHSQSRFLANSTTSTSTTTTATVPATTPSTTTAHQTVTPRARVPSSKHFSTFVSTSEDKSSATSKTGIPAANGIPAVHPLRNTWVFWFRQQHTPGSKITNYEEGIKKISAFGSVESFWSLWTHVYPPSGLLPTTDYLLFHSGVRRPVWEDPLNRAGGKWIVRLRKGIADRLWEDLVLAVIGDQFDECGPDERDGGDEWPEICGCTISVRQNEDILTVWNRSDADAKVKEKVKETIRRALNLPLATVMEYKSNNDSMQDKSSFRVIPLERPPLTPTASTTTVPAAAS